MPATASGSGHAMYKRSGMFATEVISAERWCCACHLRTTAMDPLCLGASRTSACEECVTSVGVAGVCKPVAANSGSLLPFRLCRWKWARLSREICCSQTRTWDDMKPMSVECDGQLDSTSTSSSFGESSFRGGCRPGISYYLVTYRSLLFCACCCQIAVMLCIFFQLYP